MAAQYLVSVPAKATKSVDFTDKLPRFIANNYEEEANTFRDAIKELNVLRESTVIKSPDRHDTGLDLIIRYRNEHLMALLLLVGTLVFNWGFGAGNVITHYLCVINYVFPVLCCPYHWVF